MSCNKMEFFNRKASYRCQIILIFVKKPLSLHRKYYTWLL